MGGGSAPPNPPRDYPRDVDLRSTLEDWEGQPQKESGRLSKLVSRTQILQLVKFTGPLLLFALLCLETGHRFS